MSIKFHDLKVIKVTKETADTISVSFEVPPHLKNEFQYLPGQYLTLKLKEDGTDNRRAYSISSSPYSGEPITVTIKKASEGFVSKKLHDELKEGDILEVLPPLGRFIVLADGTNSTNYVMIGAGSGITPLMSMIKSILMNEPKSNVLLLYQNRNEDSIIFYDIINRLINDYSNFNVNYILSQPSTEWKGLSGKINGDYAIRLIKENLDDDFAKNEYFLCGPIGMMQELQKTFDHAGISAEKVHREMFTAPLPELDDEKPDGTKDVIILKRQNVTIKLYGDTNSFYVEPDETITQAAMREGLEPPFSCQIGACSTCRAKTMSGKVFMDETEALTTQEINEGYVLTCQAHPLTNNVFIDFDF
jgi:ring-1,2-phenylacetyl-CoA epoxidase subunit PaaE